MNIKLVAEKTFNLLKGFGYEVSSYNKSGDLVIDPMEATRFAVESPNILVRIDPLEKHLSLKTGTPGEAIEKIRPMLKELAQDYLLDFDYSVFDKQIKPKGEKLDVAKNENKEEDPMSEDINIIKKLAGIDEGSDSTASRLGQEAEQKARAEKYYNEMKAKGITSQANEFMVKFKQLGNVDQALEAVGYFKSFDESELEENPLQRPPGADLKFGQDKGRKLSFSSADEEDMKMFYFKVGQILANDPHLKPGSPMAAEILDKAYHFHKVNNEDPKSAVEQAKLALKVTPDQAGQPTAENLDRPSLDTDLPRDYFDKLANVKKSIFAKYGNNDKVNNVISRLNDEEKANGKKADPNNIMMKVQQHLGESITEASLGKMTGSRKSSYQPLADNVKIIVRHNKEVNEEIRGARSRNIHSILIQRGEEKFKMAENNLSAARAMARHLHNGGETFDEIGEAITQMSREFKTLKEFIGYVRKAKLVNEANEEFVSLAMENIDIIKNTFKRLSGVKSYANAVESVHNYNNIEILEDDLDLESKFTETHFDDKVANAMENLKAMTSRQRSFESKIMKAIESETFDGVKDMIAEDDLLEFESLNQQLGHRVHALSNSARDESLGKYLHSISDKLNAGGQLSQFEYGAIKSCLLSAGQHNVSNAPMSVEESYEAFMDRFDV